MASYTVKIEIDPRWVNTFNPTGTHLCMAKAVVDGEGRERYNIIVTTVNEITTTMNVTWTEEYQIQALATDFNMGAKVIGTQAAKPISFGETYKAASWTKAEVVKDPENIRQDQFGFINEFPCSILLSIKQDDSFVPVYISPYRIPPGMTILRPLSKVVFWFQDRAESGIMINNFRGESITVDATGNQTPSIKYSDNGEWSIVS